MKNADSSSPVPSGANVQLGPPPVKRRCSQDRDRVELRLSCGPARAEDVDPTSLPRGLHRLIVENLRVAHRETGVRPGEDGASQARAAGGGFPHEIVLNHTVGERGLAGAPGELVVTPPPSPSAVELSVTITSVTVRLPVALASQSNPPPKPSVAKLVWFLPKRSVIPDSVVSNAVVKSGLMEMILSMPLLLVVPAWMIVEAEPAPMMLTPSMMSRSPVEAAFSPVVDVEFARVRV